MNDPMKIIGANGNRRERDFYPTPYDCTVALMDWMSSHGLSAETVWEPACGEGNITRVLQSYGCKVYESDIITGQDFLISDPPSEVDWIITNPPFAIADLFIQKASTFDIPFAFLLKSQYWHSKKRLPLFQNITPSFVLPLTWRPDFTGQGASLMDMMWVVWSSHDRTLYEPLKRPEIPKGLQN